MAKIAMNVVYDEVTKELTIDGKSYGKCGHIKSVSERLSNEFVRRHDANAINNAVADAIGLFR